MSHKILNLCQFDFFFFCLFILARHVSPVLHHPLIISKFQLLSKGKLPCFSWNTLVIALEGVLLRISLHTPTPLHFTCTLTEVATSAFQHRLTRTFPCSSVLLLQYFFLDSRSSLLLLSLPTIFEVRCLWTCCFSWGFVPPGTGLKDYFLCPSKPRAVVGISTTNFYFPSACKLRNTRSSSERY